MRTGISIKVVSGLLVVALLALGAVLYVRWNSGGSQEAVTSTAATETPGVGAVSAEDPNKVHHPVPEASEEAEGDQSAVKPAAAKNESVGAELSNRWKSFFATEDGLQFIHLENFVRHFVLMFENAREPKIPLTASIFEAVNGDFMTKTVGDKVVLSESNFHRYDPYVALVKAANLKKMVAYYSRIYPLLQAAYKELGHESYFNDRVVDVLDQMIAAKDPEGDVSFVIDGGRFVFEDIDLESAPAVQKVLIRMGPANASVVRARLAELRSLLVSEKTQ